MAESSDAGKNQVGSTFNIQNSIPHKSQKPKVAPEVNRAKEFQRGTAGVPESAKEGWEGLSEGSDIGLGKHFQTFESHTPDQTPPTRSKKRYKADKTDGFLVSCFHQYLQSQTRKHSKDDQNLCWDIFDYKLFAF